MIRGKEINEAICITSSVHEKIGHIVNNTNFNVELVK